MSPSKKRHASDSQDEASDSSPAKKSFVKQEEGMENSYVEESQASTVLFEMEGKHLNHSPAKKKKKKKKKESNESIMEDAEEISTETKKKKKKKKKHREDNSEDEDGEEIDDEMSFEDIKRMFEDIQNKLDSKANGLSKDFWNKYRFRPYSKEKCKLAFEKIMSKVQKRRTMLELVTAAGTMMENAPSTFCAKNFNSLKPVTPLKLWCDTNFKKSKEKNPELKQIEILNKITKKWSKLADEKRLKYIDQALALKHEYLEDVKEYQKIDSSFVAKPVLTKVEWQLKDKLAGLPDVPPRSGFYLFTSKSQELYPDMLNIHRFTKLRSDYKNLPAEVRQKYDSQTKEMIKEYKVKLEEYLASLSASDLEDRNLVMESKKKPKEAKVKAKNQPITNFLLKKPPKSGFMVLLKDLQEELKGIPANKRSVIASERWKSLTEEQRMEYNQRKEVMHKEWLIELKTKINAETTEATAESS